MAYDLEYSLGMYEQAFTQADHDSVADYLRDNKLFASAMNNPAFRAMVRERLVELSEGAFEPSRIIGELDGWWETWRLWNELSNRRFALDMELAELEYELARKFLAERPDYILAYYDEHARAYGDVAE